MVSFRAAHARAILLTAFVTSIGIAPLAAGAQATTAQPPPQAARGAASGRVPHGVRAYREALKSANLSSDQQSRIERLIADERNKARSESDRSARRADAKQLHDDIAATLSPDQRNAFEARMQEFKSERRAARHGMQPQNAPPPPDQGTTPHY